MCQSFDIFVIFSFFVFLGAVIKATKLHNGTGNSFSENTAFLSYPHRGERDTSIKNYYKCIKERNMIERNKAFLVMEGTEVQLDCHICIHPQRTSAYYNVVWTRSLLIGTEEQEITIDYDEFVVTYKMELVIRKVTVDDAGLYHCSVGGSVKYEYELDVVHKDNKMRQVVDEGLDGTSPAPPTIIPENNLILFSNWGSWTQCNRCNKRGQRRRVGICTLNKYDGAKPSLPTDLIVLRRFPEGIPCRSTLVPPAVSDLAQVKGRQSESMQGYCWEACPTLPAIKEIKDDQGNVIEVVRMGEGYVSMRDGPPTLPPLVKRQSMYVQEGQKLKIQCPRKLKKNEAVRWQNNTQVLDPIAVKRRTRGRVRIDDKFQLWIMRVRKMDSAPYSCWLRGIHIATIKVTVVSTGTQVEYHDYIVIAGVALTILTVVCICCTVCTSRKRKTYK